MSASRCPALTRTKVPRCPDCGRPLVFGKVSRHKYSCETPPSECSVIDVLHARGPTTLRVARVTRAAVGLVRLSGEV